MYGREWGSGLIFAEGHPSFYTPCTSPHSQTYRTQQADLGSRTERLCQASLLYLEVSGFHRLWVLIPRGHPNPPIQTAVLGLWVSTEERLNGLGQSIVDLVKMFLVTLTKS
jgi:hypothetical protein